MASFGSIQDLVSSVAKSYGSVGRDATKTANKYIKELEGMILRNLQKYYKSYTPKKHERTYQQLNIFDDATYLYDSNGVTIGFGSQAMQINAVKSDPHYSFVPELLNTGWSLSGVKTSRNKSSVNRFVYFQGSFFINNAIEEFNAKHRRDGVHAEYF